MYVSIFCCIFVLISGYYNMNAKFTTTSKGTWAYIQKSVRKNGKCTTLTIKRLGLLEDIQKREGCADPRKWVEDLAVRMTQDEKIANKRIDIEFSPSKPIRIGDRPLCTGGDLLLIPLYNKLGLPQICKDIAENSRAKYALNEILQTLVMGRILFPCSKTSTYEKAKSMVMPPKFSKHDMFRALTRLASHINDIQAQVYRNSLDVMPRRDKVIFYDCTNFYFEIEDADKDFIDSETGEFIEGLRKPGKSKEHRPNPIVQMGLFMDYDGIPLAFCIFPGNQSEQTSLQPLEEVLQTKFGMTDFIVSTDAGLGSESNRLYNMEAGREYITVQSLKSMKAKDIDMALDSKGWRISYRGNADGRDALDPENPNRDIFDLEELLSRKNAKELLRDTTFYKEILAEKELRGDSGAIETRRTERIIVTYNNDFALYQRAKRSEQLSRAEKMAKKGSVKSRQTQQDARRFVEVSHLTADGQTAIKTETAVNYELANREARFDGFYAYGTSLDDDVIDILRIRSFHHEIEHLFRTTKTFLDARPVYVSREDHIRSHFLVCFLAMTILKMLQHQLNMSELSIDQLIQTLQDTKFMNFEGKGYVPAFERNQITDRLQELAGVNLSTQIIPTRTMTTMYRNVKI